MAAHNNDVSIVGTPPNIADISSDFSLHTASFFNKDISLNLDATGGCFNDTGNNSFLQHEFECNVGAKDICFEDDSEKLLPLKPSIPKRVFQTPKRKNVLMETILEDEIISKNLQTIPILPGNRRMLDSVTRTPGCKSMNRSMMHDESIMFPDDYKCGVDADLSFLENEVNVYKEVAIEADALKANLTDWIKSNSDYFTPDDIDSVKSGEINSLKQLFSEALFMKKYIQISQLQKEITHKLDTLQRHTK